MTAFTPPDPQDLAQLRYDNVLRWFDEFVRQHVRTPDTTALRGLERRFAEQVLIQPSYWSQIKSRTRQIGERLARQFEQRCRKPMGWLDQPHGGAAPQTLPPEGEPEPLPTSSSPRDNDERFIIGLVLAYYRRHPQKARQRLMDLIGEVLTTPPPKPAAVAAPGAKGTGAASRSGAGAASTAVPDESEDQALWKQAQRGVAPLAGKGRGKRKG
jgi:hypothetical protein